MKLRIFAADIMEKITSMKTDGNILLRWHYVCVHQFICHILLIDVADVLYFDCTQLAWLIDYAFCSLICFMFIHFVCLFDFIFLFYFYF